MTWKRKLIVGLTPLTFLACSLDPNAESSSHLKRQASPWLQVDEGYFGEARCVAEPTLVIRASPSPFAADTKGRLRYNQTVLILDTTYDEVSGKLFAMVGSGWVDTTYLEKIDAVEEDSEEPDPVGPQTGSCDRRYDRRFAARGYGELATPSFLSMIAWAEGLGNCYNYTFNYQSFASYDDHPNIKVCASSYCSTAAGRYQILYKTWQFLVNKHDFPSFQPAYQDDAAVALIEEKQIYDISTEYDYDAFETVVKMLSTVWASLPESPYGQPTRTIDDAWDRYQKYLAD